MKINEDMMMQPTSLSSTTHLPRAGVVWKSVRRGQLSWKL